MTVPPGWCRDLAVITRAEHRTERFWRGIVQVFSFLADAVLALIGKSTFDAPLTRPFITYRVC